MKACGIVVEYNPFHNGHYYHLQQSKKQTESDLIIAVMSGNFLQRGEPAIVSKWDRTRMALKGGADLIIELPYLFAVSPAPIFAQASVALLSGLGADALCFGSESGNIDSFYHTISQVEKQKVQYDEMMQQLIKSGYSFPKASSLALESLSTNGASLDSSMPNNILGLEYVKAIEQNQFKMEAHTITRIGAGFHDEEIEEGKIASATAIRKALFEQNQNNPESVKMSIPSYTHEVLMDYAKHDVPLMNWERYFPLLRYKILSSSEAEIKALYEVEEGLEHRLKSVITKAKSFHDFMAALKTKRYTWTRLQRMCLHILNNVSKELAQRSLGTGPEYIRVLGMSTMGQRYLKAAKEHARLPIISNISHATHEMAALEKRTSDIYSAGYPLSLAAQKRKEEYSTPPFRYDPSKDLFL